MPGRDLPRVVALGGGHGLASTLRAVRLYASQLTAVVSVADDGGSSGRLREIAGIPAPGDLRRCLVALAADGSPWAPAFEYRFPSGAGDLEGHALGNLVIAGLANVTGDFARALDLASDLVGAIGRVVPATSVPVVLKAEISGEEVLGQVAVSETSGVITSVSIVPPDASVPDEALEAIAEADQVVLGPGSLYTSVLAVAAVPGIRAALEARRGGRVYVCNLRPQPPETAGFGEAEHLAAVLDHGVPVDVMVCGSAAGPDRIGGVEVVRGDLGRPDGSGHDPGGLAAVLSRLT
ncbi:MAG TPA: gluconeogenesis factor YvcK family protein [Acidimicrobiales bacterium]|nr:gluconeogenesis factor YvcK family protein [Acidimicrobiales bacterium]